MFPQLSPRHVTLFNIYVKCEKGIFICTVTPEKQESEFEMKTEVVTVSWRDRAKERLQLCMFHAKFAKE